MKNMQTKMPKRTLCVAVANLVLGILISFTVGCGSDAGRKTCATNMRMINSAKEMFSVDMKKKIGDPVSEGDIKAYMAPKDLDKGIFLPVCPQGGSYTINPIGVLPECSIHGILRYEDPR
jgi:hypothetical protein